MTINPRKLNTFLMFKLPSAYFTGVRTKYLDNEKCIVSVKHRWINQNPFKSLFWAVQGMAAELTTGALIIKKIKETDKDIAMLLVKNDASYSKKATGRITFECTEGKLIDGIIKKAIESREGQLIALNVIGRNSDNIEVSKFSFTWSIKVRA
ncbi:DUF4442 domain-containing protein [Flavobacteriaceae bacterium S0825]|nr:DUF4442 domain-containing protein [Gaetbulibacter sp. S0825]MCK0110070.1 DUF4442 domain-containing protein [Flavobacteriaceae bacterium S0825]NIX65699.1 DUF4442 domain-containing protein [Gaetbulibacter sp. S0825]